MTFIEYSNDPFSKEIQTWLFSRARQLLNLRKDDFVMSVTVHEEGVNINYTLLKFKLARKYKTYTLEEFFQ